MSILKLTRPVALATLLAFGVAAAVAGSAEARTGIKSQHGPCHFQPKDPQTTGCQPIKR